MGKRKLILKAGGDLFEDLSKLDFERLSVEVVRDESGGVNWILQGPDGVEEDQVDLRDWMERDILVEACRGALIPSRSKKRTSRSCPACGMAADLSDLFGA